MKKIETSIFNMICRGTVCKPLSPAEYDLKIKDV